jgi:hypothetical protein
VLVGGCPLARARLRGTGREGVASEAEVRSAGPVLLSEAADGWRFRRYVLAGEIPALFAAPWQWLCSRRTDARPERVGKSPQPRGRSGESLTVMGGCGCDRAEIELAGFIDALLTETYLLIELANNVRFFEPWPSKGTARVAHPSLAYL